MSLSLHEQQVVNWLATGETGESSKTMALWLAFGARYKGASHPYDPDDLDRCLKLLAAAPALRERIPSMAKVSKHWAALVTQWDAVEASHLQEVGLGWTKGRIAPETYKLMKGIYRTVERPANGRD